MGHMGSVLYREVFPLLRGSFIGGSTCTCIYKLRYVIHVLFTSQLSHEYSGSDTPTRDSSPSITITGSSSGANGNLIGDNSGILVKDLTVGLCNGTT